MMHKALKSWVEPKLLELSVTKTLSATQAGPFEIVYQNGTTEFFNGLS